jgi:hypothetical protein
MINNITEAIKNIIIIILNLRKVLKLSQQPKKIRSYDRLIPFIVNEI